MRKLLIVLTCLVVFALLATGVTLAGSRHFQANRFRGCQPPRINSHHRTILRRCIPPHRSYQPRNYGSHRSYGNRSAHFRPQVRSGNYARASHVRNYNSGSRVFYKAFGPPTPGYRVAYSRPSMSHNYSRSYRATPHIQRYR